MKATEAKLLEFLKKAAQFVIPIYQRTYSWGEKECQQLWDDIVRAGKNDNVPAHFVGSIVYVEKGLYQVSSQSPLLVIDGQQRLTTVTLLIEALARRTGTTEPMDGFSAKKLRNYYLLNDLEEGEKRYKLMLSQTDKASLIAVLDQQPQPKDHSLRVQANFEFFEKQLNTNPAEIDALCKGLAKLIVVDISLNRDQDNPQLIFESLNSTGLELSQADLIRNFILMGLETQLKTRLYEQYWRPMEVNFGQEAYASQFDSFMRHYLTVKTGEIPTVRAVYDAFKQYARSGQMKDTEELVADIRTYAGYYCALALGSETDPDLKTAFQDIRELRYDVAYPLFLELYHDYADKKLPKTAFVQAVRLVESYMFRRAVCNIATNSMNKTFATFSRAIKKDKYLENIEAHFLMLPSYRRFPTDEEFHREIQTRDLYHFRSRSFWLRRMENHGRKERVHVDEYTIEHIMPQNENLSDAWKTELGPDWEQTHSAYLHTLGNLTLTGYNPELSDRPFAEKKTMKGGFAQSPLHLNQGLGSVAKWDRDAIMDRAGKLATLATAVWISPKLSAQVLETYKPKSISNVYTIANHPHLESGPLRTVFDEFRKQVLALDLCVTEEFLKLYVAYKAETNFVDIIPQAKRLLLSLNLAFSEISDPKGICKDVTGMGRWGNGDVEVGLSSIAEIPYIVGLVRQAYEKQMGSGADT